MRGLKICLWMGGAFCLLSVFGVFLPISVFESIAKCFGVESAGFADSPLIEYAVRLMSGTYVAVGVYLVILAREPMKYGVLVPFTAVASVLLGAGCVVTGMMVGMPVQWFLGDGVPCIVFGVVVLLLWRRVKGEG